MNHNNLNTGENENRSRILGRLRRDIGSVAATEAMATSYSVQNEDGHESREREVSPSAIGFEPKKARNLVVAIASSQIKSGEKTREDVMKEPGFYLGVKPSTLELTSTTDTSVATQSVYVQHELVSYTDDDGQQHILTLHGTKGIDEWYSQLFVLDNVIGEKEKKSLNAEPAVLFGQHMRWRNDSDTRYNGFEPPKNQLNQALQTAFSDQEGFVDFVKAQLEGGDVSAKSAELVEALRQRHDESPNAGQLKYASPIRISAPVLY